MERYCRNIGVLSEEEQKLLNSKRALVIGSGGLGGFVIEGLIRMGINTIGICDFDVADISNLNRQILVLEETIGKEKVDLAESRIKNINSAARVIKYMSHFPSEEVVADLDNYDIVIDCLDNFESRVKLEKECVQRNLIVIHGGVGGNYGQVGVVSNDNKLISLLNEFNSDIQQKLGNPYYIVSVVSALQVHLAILVLLNREYLSSGFYQIDLNSFVIQCINI